MKGDIDDEEGPGREVVLQLSRLLRVAGLHHLNNDAVTAAIEPFVAAVAAAHATTRIQAVNDAVFCDSRLVKPRGEMAEATLHLRRLFARLRITEISFASEMSTPDTLEFLGAVQAASAPRGPSLIDSRVPHVVVRFDPGAAPQLIIDPRLNVARCYAQLLVMTDEACQRLSDRRPAGFARVRRAMQAFCDASVGHENLALGLVRFDGVHGGLAAHLVAVAIYVLVMARRLELKRAPLMSLCMGALWHDVGLVDDDVEAGDSGVVRDRIGIRSALHLSRAMPPLLAVENICVALEVSALLGNDAGVARAGQSAAALTAIPCAFDQLIAGGARHAGVAPDVALRGLLEHPRQLDPVILKLFASTVGLYPVGTVVRLSQGQTAIVVAVPNDPAQWARPIVKVVREGNRAADLLVDLAQPGEDLRILRSCGPEEERQNVAHFMLA